MNYNQNIRFDKSILVEVVLTSGYAAGSTIPFPDVPQLRGKYVQGIEGFTSSHLTKSPNNNTVFENGAAPEVLVTFQEAEKKRYENVPFYTLIAANNGGLIREFKNLQININACQLKMGGTTGTAGRVVVFNFYYSDRPL